MIRRHMLFFATPGDCGCSTPTSYPQRGNGLDCGLVPTTGAVVADNRYFSLAGSPKGKILVVPLGSNAQHFLTSASKGFVFSGATGESEITATPKLNLPVLNPAVSGVYPAPGSFRFLTIGTAATDSEWMHVAAPSTGTYNLQAKNGNFQLVPSGIIPGLDEVGAAGVVTDGNPIVIVEYPANSGQYAMAKLQVINGRPYVGDTTGGGTGRIRPLGQNEVFTVTNAHFGGLIYVRQFRHLGPGGLEVPNGMLHAVPAGEGADAEVAGYSSTMRMFYKMPVRTHSQRIINTNDAFGSIPASFTALPGTHLNSGAVATKYAQVRIDGAVSFTGDERASFGLFRDGTLLQEFSTDNAMDPTFFYQDSAVPIGTHTWEFRWKKSGAGSGGGTVKFSNVMVTPIL